MPNIIVNVQGVVTNLQNALAKAKGMINSFVTSTAAPPVGGGPLSHVLMRGFPDLQQALLETIDKYRDLQYRIEQSPMSAKLANKWIQQLNKQMSQDLDALAKKFLPENMGVKEYINSLKAMGYESGVLGSTWTQIEKELTKGESKISRAGRALIQFSGGIGNAGRRLSWFGFRLTMMGRLFSRFITKILRKALSGFEQWDQTIINIGTSMGFLTAQGLLTGDMQNMMISAMQDLPIVGMQVQGIIGALSALFVNIGSTIIPIFSRSIMDLIGVIWDLWETNKDDLIPIFERLANEVIPKFTEIIKRVGPEAFEGLVTGITKGVEALTQLMDVLEPHLPKLSEWLGLIIGLSPVLTGLGLALFFLSIPLQLVGDLIRGASGLLKIFGTALGGVEISAIGLGAAVFILAGFVGALIFWWDELVASFNNLVGPAVKDLWDAICRLGEAISPLGTAMDFVKGMTIPFKLALEGVMVWLNIMLRVITALIDKLTWFVESLKTAKEWLGKVFGGGNKDIEEFQKTHNDLMSDLDNAYGQSIGDIMAQQFDIARESLEALIEVQKNPTIIPQTIPIDVQISIGNLSSDVDIDTLTSEVSRKLADRMEGVFNK